MSTSPARRSRLIRLVTALEVACALVVPSGCRSQPEPMPSAVPTDTTSWICPGVENSDHGHQPRPIEIPRRSECAGIDAPPD